MEPFKTVTISVSFVIMFLICSMTALETEWSNDIDPWTVHWEQAGVSLPNGLPTDYSEEYFFGVGQEDAILDAINTWTPDEGELLLIKLDHGTYTFDDPIVIPSQMILRGYTGLPDRPDDQTAYDTVLKFHLTNNEDNCITFDNTENSGLEDVCVYRDEELTNLDMSGDVGANIILKGSSDCWVTGVESQHPVRNHLVITSLTPMETDVSCHNYIFGCYFNNAQGWGEGGYGYGVLLDRGSTYNLVENNIFYTNRHGVVIQNQCEYNVVSYNYFKASMQSNLTGVPLIDGSTLTADITLHGRSAYEATLPENGGGTTPYPNGSSHNLIEGNICKWMWVDSFHGANGELNTFFRNRSSRYGFCVFPELPEEIWDFSEPQIKQQFCYNYLKSSLYQYGLDCISNFAPYLMIYLLDSPYWGALDDIDEMRNILEPRSFAGPTPFEKQTKVRRMNWLGTFTTHAWTDGVKDRTAPNVTNDYSYYLADEPDWIPEGQLGVWPYSPENSDYNVASLRYMSNTEKTVSRLAPNMNLIHWEGELEIDYSYRNSLDVGEWATFYLYPWETLIIMEGSHVTFTNDLKYRLYGNVIVEPNVTIEFESGVYFEAYGCINALDSEFIGDGLCFYPQDYGYIPKPRIDFIWSNYSNTHVRSALFQNCTFHDGSDWSGDYPYGGIAEFHYYDKAEFVNCSFSNNSAQKGGAVYLNGSDVTFKACTFSSNSSQWGSAIYAFESNPFIDGCAFQSNVAPEGIAAGLYLCSDPYNNGLNVNSERDEAIITNSFFCNNSSNSIGSAIVMIDRHNVLLFQNTFLNNINANGPNTMYISASSGQSNIAIVNNLFWCIGYNPMRDEVGQSAHLNISGEDTEILLIGNAMQGGDAYCGECDNEIYLEPDEVSFVYSNSYELDDSSVILDTSAPLSELMNRSDYSFDYQSLMELDITGEGRELGSPDPGCCEAVKTGISLSENFVHFGNVAPGQKTSYKLPISNTSEDVISNIDLTYPGAFSDRFIITDFPEELAPGEESAICLEYIPTSHFKESECNIIMTSNDQFHPSINIGLKAYTYLHDGANWVSFPYNELNTIDVLQQLEPDGISVTGSEGRIVYDSSSWDFQGLESLDDNSLYKVLMSDDCSVYEFVAPSTPANTSFDLLVGVDNWVGYWLEDSKDMDDAFGEYWDVVDEVRSENWYYGGEPQNNGRGVSDPNSLPSSLIRPLHFGCGYIVRVAEPVIGFEWNDSNIGSTTECNLFEQPEYFECDTTTEDYTVVDVIGIDSSIDEIGAFSEGECIGASTVKDSTAQILIYTEMERATSPIYFEVYDDDLRSSLEYRDYLIFDEGSGTYATGVLYTNSRPYGIVDLDMNLGDPAPPIIYVSNYPNPFNPETTISFTLPEQAEVSLSVYNIRGQRIATLVNETLASGRHETVWNGRDANDVSVSSGVYFYRLATGGKSITNKMLLLK